MGAAERQQFSVEFPQFMCYVAGAPVAISRNPSPALGVDASPPLGMPVAAPPPPEPVARNPSSDGTQLRVHGLAASATAKELATFFGQHGRLLGVTVKRPVANDPAALSM